MIIYIVRDFEDRVIGSAFDRKTAIDIFKEYKPYFTDSEIDPFIYEEEIHFTECPESEYFGILIESRRKYYFKMRRALINCVQIGDPELLLEVLKNTFKISFL